jgi:hypothetical protein
LQNAQSVGSLEDANGKALYDQFLEGSVELQIFSTPEQRVTFLPFISKHIEKNMDNHLKQICESLNVNIPEVIDVTLQRLVPLDGSTPEPFVIAGKTQSGKSAFKAVVISVCTMLRMPTILMTKDDSESKDLHETMVKYLAGSGVEEHVFPPYTHSEADITAAFNTNGGTLVIPDTFQKINFAIRIIERYRNSCTDKKSINFVLILDEADAMYRTVDRSQRMEVALKELQGFNPTLQLFVSATPVPILLLYKEVFMLQLSMYSLEASHDYVGVHRIKCLEDDNGSPIYLDPLLQ